MPAHAKHYQPGLICFTLHTVINVLERLGPPNQIRKVLNLAQRGPLIVTLATEMAELYAWILNRQACGLDTAYERDLTHIHGGAAYKELKKQIHESRRKIWLLEEDISRLKSQLIEETSHSQPRERGNSHEPVFVKFVAFPKNLVTAIEDAERELEQWQSKEQSEILKVRSMPDYLLELGVEGAQSRLFGLSQEKLVSSDGAAFVLRNTATPWFNHFVEQVDQTITQTYYGNSQDLIFRDSELHAQILRDYENRDVTVNLEQVFARMAQLPCTCPKANEWRQAKNPRSRPNCGCALRWKSFNTISGDCVRGTRSRLIEHDEWNCQWIRRRYGTGNHPLDPYRKDCPTLGEVEDARNQLLWCLCDSDFELFFRAAKFEITSETTWEDRAPVWKVSPPYFEGESVDFEQVILPKRKRKQKQSNPSTIPK